MRLLLREGYWTQGVGKMHFKGRHYGLRDLLTMEECVDHVADDDYLMYLREHGIRVRYPMGIRDLLFYQPQTSGMLVEHSPTSWVADRSVEFLREHTRYRQGEPFFLWSSCTSPHPPFAPCEPYDSMYDPADMDPPVYADRPISELPSFLWGSRGRMDGGHRDPERMRRIRALYYGLITHIDDAFGKILEELKALQLWDNTVVFLVSDHGDMLGDHGLSQKNCPYEPSIRIPFMMRWPGRTQAGKECGDLVGLTDVLPTLVGELGLEYPRKHGPLPGESLLGAEGGGLSSARDCYFVDYGSGRQRWVAARTSTHMCALFADGGELELYDLEDDPYETRNLAEEMGDVAGDFRELILEWERRNGMAGSFDDGMFKTYPRPPPPTEDGCRTVVINMGPWPKRLAGDGTTETFAQSFSRAILKETTLSPDKLSIGQYKDKIRGLRPADRGGESLVGTPWENAG
jgi:arylsulfatase A-like enzyme